MLTRVDHIGIETIDIDADVTSLTEVMGLTVWRWGVHTMTGGRIAMLHDGRATKLELIEVDRIDGRLAHVAFGSADVRRDCLAAVDRGVASIVEPFRIEAAAATSALLRGSGSTLIQLIQYDSDSPDVDPWNNTVRW